METAKHRFPIFIISGKSPIGATGGGYSTYAYNLARILKSQGYDVYICALGDKNEEVKTPVGTLLLVRASVPILNVNVYALPGLPYYSFLFAKRIDKVIREEHAGKFIVWGIGPWGLAAPLLKLNYKGRLIHLNNYFTSVRHEWLGGVAALKISDYGIWQKIKYLFVYLTAVQLLAQFEKIVLKSAKLIITNYKSTEEILVSEFKINRGRFYRARF